MLAALDVGSNTVRLLLGSVTRGKVLPQLYARRVTRLKGGQTLAGLSPEGMTRTLSALHDFSKIINQYTPSVLRAVGTEALRSAANGEAFAARVFNETGLLLEIIDGTEEARLAAAGVSSIVSQTPPDTCLIFDIGGGSTEFILMQQGVILFQQSLHLGVIDLTETFSAGDRLAAIHASILEFSAGIYSSLQHYSIMAEDITLIGTAGTVTTLAALEMQMRDYDWRRVNGFLLSLDSIEDRYRQLLGMSVAAREQLPGMEKGRGDLIIAGIEITLEIMRQFNFKNLTVSDFGLLEGILLKMPSINAPNR